MTNCHLVHHSVKLVYSYSHYFGDILGEKFLWTWFNCSRKWYHLQSTLCLYILFLVLLVYNRWYIVYIKLGIVSFLVRPVNLISNLIWYCYINLISNIEFDLIWFWYVFLKMFWSKITWFDFWYFKFDIWFDLICIFSKKKSKITLFYFWYLTKSRFDIWYQYQIFDIWSDFILENKNITILFLQKKRKRQVKTNLIFEFHLILHI